MAAAASDGGGGGGGGGSGADEDAIARSGPARHGRGARRHSGATACSSARAPGMRAAAATRRDAAASKVCRLMLTWQKQRANELNCSRAPPGVRVHRSRCGRSAMAAPHAAPRALRAAPPPPCAAARRASGAAAGAPHRPSPPGALAAAFCARTTLPAHAHCAHTEPHTPHTQRP
jgi:hypothetical protein